MTRDEVIKGLEVVKETLENECYFFATMWINDAIALLKAEPKRGSWIISDNGEWACSECGFEPTVYEGTPFCPNCGAKMEADDGNDEG